MNRIVIKAIILPLTAIAMCSCSALNKVNWNSQALASAASKAITAATLSDEQVIQLCAQSARQMDAENQIDRGEYNSRLSKLMKGTDQINGLKLNFKVYRTNEINAFAMADGTIRVYSGLMDVMDDAELVSIIGHEIGHVCHQDSKNAMKQAYMASAVTDVVASAGQWGALSASLLGQVSEAFVNAKFSQKQEFAADDYGFQFAIDKGYSPYSMSNALNKLVTLSGGSQASSIAKMFSSHPDSAVRAAKMLEKAKNYESSK